MEPSRFCQSCSMPIDKIEDRGTEKDGTNSEDYCKYCYRDGKFVDPSMTMEQMKHFVDTKMHEMNLPAGLIRRSLDFIPGLKRWQK